MIRNIINNKKYIGQSVDILGRAYGHICESKNSKSNGYDYPLYRAFRKYGIENFEVVVIKECNIEDLNYWELHYISDYNTISEGYNQTLVYFNRSIVKKKLNIKQVEEIIELLKKDNITIDEIAIRYNVFRNTIYNINSGRCFFNNKNIYPIADLKLKIKYKTIDFKCFICNEYKKGRINSKICNDCKLEGYKRIGRKRINNKDNKKREALTNINCKSCGKNFKPRYKKNIYCSLECSKFDKRVVERPTKEELNILLKENSYEAIGRMYGVSGTAVRKWKDSYN